MAYFRRYYSDVHTPEYEPKNSIQMFEKFLTRVEIFDSPKTKTKIITKPEFRKVLDQWHR